MRLVRVPPNPAPEEIRPSASGNDHLIDALVGGSFEIMSPSLLDTPGGFRPFLRLGLGATFGPQHDVAKEGVPGRFRLPQASLGIFEEDAILGQGSKTSVRYLTFAPSAAIGVAFTVRYGDRTLRIRPSFEYLWQEVTTRGVMKRAVGTTGQSLDDFRLLALLDDTEQGFHAIGPGLELEVDAARARSAMFSVYLGAKFFAPIGGTQVNLSDTNALGESARWEADLDRWRSSAMLIGGESAGGHLTLVTALRLRDRLSALDRLLGLNLVFGIYDLNGTPSQRGNGGRKDMLTPDGRRFIVECFTPGMSEDARRAPDISPLFTDLAGLPPCLVTVGALDHLLDDSLFLAPRLANAGVEVELQIYPDSPHGFMALPTRMSAAYTKRTDAWLGHVLDGA